MNFIQQYKEISLYRKKLDVITNNIHYPIATSLCVIISSTAITPNIITLIGVIFALLAIWFIYIDLLTYNVMIVILLQFGWICDLLDGMLARYKKLGYYHHNKPSLKGYYWDSISDHVLRLLVLTFLGIYLAQHYNYGVYLAIGGIAIHAITQVEHVLRNFILKGVEIEINLEKNKKQGIFDQIILIFNNIYIFYFIFILINRIDLLFIVLPITEIILLIKRFVQFSFSKY